ncbi:MAG: porin [Gemmatimonadaceae bacterium]|nr:porin [Acetobacteraceae bacterium]
MLITAMTVMLASPAVAQTSADEITQLRTLLRQQTAAMQAMQRRLDAIEARQRAPGTTRPSAMAQAGSPPAASPPAGSAVSTQGPGTAQPPNTGSVEANPRQQAAQSGTLAAPNPAASVPADGLTPGPVPAQPPNTGTVEANPLRQAGQTGTLTTAAAGNPPLPVLSASDRVQVTLSGQVNRMILGYSDGSGRVDPYFVDNNASSTRLRVLGSARLDPDTTAVSAIEFDLRSNASSQITRQTANNNGGDTPGLGPFRIRRAEVGLQSAYGTVLLGRGSTFGDGIAEFDLSGTDVALYAALSDTGGNLQFSNRTGTRRLAADPTIAQTFDDFDGFRDDRIRYDTPAWNGLSGGISVAQGGSVDVGLRYARTIAGTRIVGGVAYMDSTGTLPSTQSQDGSNAPLTPFARRVAGSVAVLLPSGFNFLASGGWGQHYGTCCGTGLNADNDGTTYFLKAGYQANIFSFGPTNFALQGGQTFNRIRDGDVASRYGVSFSQPVIARGFELYAGYEHLTLRRSGAARYEPADIALIGSRIQF